MAHAGSFGDELRALGAVLEALEPLTADKREFVIATATARLGIASVPASSAPRSSSTAGSTTKNELPADISPKDFVKAKKPSSEPQRAACLAYYLTHFRNQPHFKTRDLTNLNTEAACPKLSNPARTVDNATKQNGFFAPAGQGNKQITPYGEDVVNSLPDQDAVDALRRESGPGRKRGTGKRGGKKRA